MPDANKTCRSGSFSLSLLFVRPVLILSMHPEDQYAKRVLKAGAAGYMNKETAPKELVKAVRKVLAGGRYTSEALAEKLAFDLSAGAANQLS
jgi:two-component system invasion response regulator UvrY